MSWFFNNSPTTHYNENEEDRYTQDDDNTVEETENNNEFELDYTYILNEYLSNIQTIRRALRQTIDYQNAYLIRIHQQINILNNQNENLYELLLSNRELSNSMQHNRNLITQQRPRDIREFFSSSARQPATATMPSTTPATIPPVATNTGRLNRTLFNIQSFIPQTFIDVAITPTHQQINAACSVVLYNTIDEAFRHYDRCPISYIEFNADAYVMRINTCGHYFDTDSLLGWFRNSVVCPLCRVDIRTSSNTPETPPVSSTNTVPPTTNPDTRHYEFITNIPTNLTSQAEIDQFVSNFYNNITNMLNSALPPTTENPNNR
jgi:hypothetical protein